MIQFGGNIKFPGNSGEIQALQNSTTLRSTSSGHVIIGSPHALIPEVDASQDLGLDFLRWNDLYISQLRATSGIFDGIRPTSSTKIVLEEGMIAEQRWYGCIGDNDNPFETMAFASGLQIKSIAGTPTTDFARASFEIRCSGHFAPGHPEGGLGETSFTLGTPGNIWSNLHAASGTYSAEVTTPDLQTVQLNGFGGGDITVGNSMIPGTDDSIDLGSTTNRWSILNAVSGTFSERPSVLTSGVALRNEMYWEHILAGVDIGGAVTLQAVQDTIDTLSTDVYPVPINRRCRLYPHFTMTTAHANGSAPTDWIVVIYKNQALAASGVFSWSTTGAVQMTRNPWSDPVSFDPGDNYSALVHNDGSGTAINITVTKFNFGFELDIPE